MHKARGTLLPPGDIPIGAEIIDVKWVYQLKDNGTRYKARVVARGDKETSLTAATYSPTSNKNVMWLLFSLMVILRLKTRVIDITGAFVAEKITRNAWLNVNGVHYKLGTFLYGLKDAAREFYEKSSEHLMSNGFIKSIWDQCLFVKWISYTKFTYVIVHVDDFLCIASADDELDDLSCIFRGKYEITESPLHTYLGIHMNPQSDGSMIFTRPGQLNKIFAAYITADMSMVYPDTPMLIGKTTDISQDTCDKTKYQELCGSLIQIIDVRPDIKFALSRCAQRTQHHLKSDMKALLRIVLYLKGTEELGIRLQPGNHQYGSTYVMLRGYADASYANEPGSRSMYSVSYDLLPVPLEWHKLCRDEVLKSSSDTTPQTGHFTSRNSTIQDVSLSSTDAEIYALTEAMKDVLFFRGVLGELHQPQLQPTVIFNDNQSAMTLATAFGGNMKNVKYMMPRVHWCMECTKKGLVQTHWMPTEDLTPDIGTKSLPVKDFTKKRGQLLGFPSDAIRVKESVIKHQKV
jgi:hypothetical protein